MSESDNIINPTEISLDNWSALTPQEQVIAFQKLSYSEADHFFLALSSRDQGILMLALPATERRLWMRLLPPDDATDLIQETIGPAAEPDRELRGTGQHRAGLLD